MRTREIVLSVEALGSLADDEDVKAVLREVWVELKQMEKEEMKSSYIKVGA